MPLFSDLLAHLSSANDASLDGFFGRIGRSWEDCPSKNVNMAQMNYFLQRMEFVTIPNHSSAWQLVSHVEQTSPDWGWQRHSNTGKLHFRVPLEYPLQKKEDGYVILQKESKDIQAVIQIFFTFRFLLFPSVQYPFKDTLEESSQSDCSPVTVVDVISLASHFADSSVVSSRN